MLLKTIAMLFFIMALVQLPVRAETVTFKTTGETIEIDADGNPTNKEIRRIDPEQVDEKFWNLKLEDVEGELVRTKEGRTLYVSEQGDLYLKGGGAATLPGATAAATTTTIQPPPATPATPTVVPSAADHAVGATTGSVTLPGGGSVSIAADMSPAIALDAVPASVRVGEEVAVKVSVGRTPPGPVTAGLSLGYDPNVLSVSKITVAEGCELVQQSIREVNAERHVLRLLFRRDARPQEDAAVLATIVCRGAGPGQVELEPLSVEATARLGKTFIQSGNQVIKPTVTSRRIEIR